MSKEELSARLDQGWRFPYGEQGGRVPLFEDRETLQLYVMTHLNPDLVIIPWQVTIRELEKHLPEHLWTQIVNVNEIEGM